MENLDKKKINKFVRCCVKGCNSTSSKNPELCFHKFPKPNVRFVYKPNMFGKLEKIDHSKAWQIVLKISKNSNLSVCSLHFLKDDYALPDVATNKKRLKNTAVPSVNISSVNEKKAKRALDGEKRVLKREKCVIKMKIEKNLNVPKCTVEAAENECMVQESVTDQNINTPEDGLKQDVSYSCIASVEGYELKRDASCSCVPSVKSAEVQVNTILMKTEFKYYLQDDSKLSTMTGIESFAIFETIVQMVKEVYKDNRQENSDKIDLRCKIDIADKILLTFVKLKQNLSYSCLAILFNCCTVKHCSSVFDSTIRILSQVLQVAIPWPSRQEIMKNLPTCFEGFENVRVVLDCTEIFIQRPKNLCCQLLTYSNYKGNQTGKFMTAVSPAGNVTYVSRVFGGRTSDSAIFSQSDLLQLLEHGDGIMVDRGFLIDEECEKHGWILIRPPFLHNKTQFDKTDSVLTSRIAKARVHMERSNQRIKTFKILGITLPAQLVPVIEDIFKVICATINMSSPILSDSKFMQNK